MNATYSKGEVVLRLVAKLEAAEHSPVYLRGYEQLPHEVGNDVDLLVAAGSRHACSAILQNESYKLGWHLLTITEFSPLALCFGNFDTGDTLHIDLFERLEWHALEFADARQIQARRKSNGMVHTPAPDDEVYLNLVTRLIYQGTVREKHRRQAEAAFAPNNTAHPASVFQRHLGMAGMQIFDQLRDNQWAPVSSSRRNLIRAVTVQYGLKKPIRLCRGILNYGRRLLSKLIRPPGLFIVFEGADGVGKSTIMRSIVPWSSSLCGGRAPIRFHWKPTRVTTDEPSSSVTVDPRGKPLRPFPFSVLFMLYHLLGYWFGWLLHIYPKLVACRPVIGDRYSYDLFLDPKRFRLNLPDCICRIAAFLTPQPNAVVFLGADPEIIIARKPELSVDEIRSYQSRWEKLEPGRAHFLTVDASEDPESVTLQVKRELLRYLVSTWQKP